MQGNRPSPPTHTHACRAVLAAALRESGDGSTDHQARSRVPSFFVFTCSLHLRPTRTSSLTHPPPHHARDTGRACTRRAAFYPCAWAPPAKAVFPPRRLPDLGVLRLDVRAATRAVVERTQPPWRSPGSSCLRPPCSNRTVSGVARRANQKRGGGGHGGPGMNAVTHSHAFTDVSPFPIALQGGANGVA